MSKLKGIWNSLIYYPGILGNFESKQEIIFNLIIISGIIYLTFAAVILLTIAYIAITLYNHSVLNSLSYAGLNLVAIVLFIFFLYK